MDIDIYVKHKHDIKKNKKQNKGVWAKRPKGKGIGIQCHGTPSACSPIMWLIRLRFSLDNNQLLKNMLIELTCGTMYSLSVLTVFQCNTNSPSMSQITPTYIRVSHILIHQQEIFVQ